MKKFFKTLSAHYFLKLESKIDHFDLQMLVNSLRVIDKIDYLARLDINKIKNK